jgi:hypothetical protein
VRAATDTVIRAGFGSIVIWWLGPGSLNDLVSMALVLPAVDVKWGEARDGKLRRCADPFAAHRPTRLSGEIGERCGRELVRRSLAEIGAEHGTAAL